MAGSSILLFNGCSAASCDFGALARGDKHPSFYSTILNWKPRGLNLTYATGWEILNLWAHPQWSKMQVLPSSALPSLLWLLCLLPQGGCYASSHHFQFPGRNKRGGWRGEGQRAFFQQGFDLCLGRATLCNNFIWISLTIAGSHGYSSH